MYTHPSAVVTQFRILQPTQLDKQLNTGTALLKVFNDLLQAADQGQVSALCLLDLTAAFDTVDHHVLLQRLQRSFGIEDCALAWFRSYLSDRSYCVVYGGVSSQLI